MLSRYLLSGAVPLEFINKKRRAARLKVNRGAVASPVPRRETNDKVGRADEEQTERRGEERREELKGWRTTSSRGPGGFLL